jgi:probable O-glycosylation ligase (exosortase A-associated)
MKGLLFTYLLTYGGAVASLVNPYVGLLVYVCFAIIRPESLWHWSVEPGNYSRIVAIALLIGWAIHGFGNWRFGRARGVVIALLAFWGWSVVGAVFADDQQVAWDFVESKSKIFLPFLVGITLIDSMPKLKQLAWVILLSQGYVALEMNRAYLDGFNWVKEIGFGGMDNNCVAIGMVSAAGLAFFFGLHAERWWAKLLALAAAALMAHVVFLSFSRGGMLALLVTGGISFLLIPKRWGHYLLFALAVVVALRMAGPEVWERFLSSFEEREELDASAISRLELWAACWDLMLRYPLLGVGPDHFPQVVHEYGFPPGKHAHTLWLNVGAEQGFPGLAFLVLFFGLCAYRLWPLTKENRPAADPWLRHAARMVIASLVGFAVAGQFVALLGIELPYYIALLGVATLKEASQPSARSALVLHPAADDGTPSVPRIHPGLPPPSFEG